MSPTQDFDYILIRDCAVLLKLPRDRDVSAEIQAAEFFDVRTGAPLKEIHPPLRASEPDRGYALDEAAALTIISSGLSEGDDPSLSLSKVVSISEVKQRRLDSVVADSVLDQVKLISDLLSEFTRVAECSDRDIRFWMSQQALTLLRKFSGRELQELREIIEWLRSRPKR